MRRIAVAVLLALTAATPAFAATVAGLTIPDEADVGGKKLVLNGTGLRAKFVVKVYVAALYFPEKRTKAKDIVAADEPRRAQMSFLYDVSKDQLCGAWNEGLEANTPDASAEVKAGFKTLCDAMPAQTGKSEIAFNYVPGKGTEIFVKNQSKGTIAGKPFADALLKCWIGKEPAGGAAFKKSLLGGGGGD